MAMTQTLRAADSSGPLGTQTAPAMKSLMPALEEPLVECRRRESTLFEQSVGEDATTARLILFGAGNLGRMTLRKLRDLGIKPVAFADNDQAKWGTSIDSLPVMSLAEACSKFGEDAVFVVTVWSHASPDTMFDRIETIRLQGARRVVPFSYLSYRFPEAFLPYFAIDLPSRALGEQESILRSLERFTEPRSRSTFIEQILWRLSGDFSVLKRGGEDREYFLPEIRLLGDKEVFVDCGAFDGDTLQSFFEANRGQSSRVMAFEPDPENFSRLTQTAERFPQNFRKTIHVTPAAVSDQNGSAVFQATGTGAAAFGSTGVTVSCVRLDEALEGVRPTFIKMDIEGAEPLAIAGARRLIKEHCPVLAICAYHLQGHVWSIVKQIHEIHGSYEFLLRAHRHDGFDLVLYAIPPDRKQC